MQQLSPQRPKFPIYPLKSFCSLLQRCFRTEQDGVAYGINVGVANIIMINSISTGLFLHPICTAGGANLPPYLKTDLQMTEVRFFSC